MSNAYTGGCACGRIRYEISGEPIFMGDANAVIANTKAARVTAPTSPSRTARM